MLNIRGSGIMSTKLCNRHACLSGRTHSYSHHVRLAVAQRLSKGSRTRHVKALNSWKITQDNSDGDLEYYRFTSRLSDQFEWFGPRKEEPAADDEEEFNEEQPVFGLSPKEIAALGLAGPQRHSPDSRTLSSRHVLCGPKSALGQLGYTPSKFMDPGEVPHVPLSRAAQRMQSTNAPIGSVYESPRADSNPYRQPEGRAVYWPESERYGDPPDLPSLLLANRVIYVAMPFVPQVTELVVAQCVYLEGDEKNRNVPIYVYLNSTGCHNDQGQAIASDYEFMAIWAALGFTRAPIYTGVIGYAKNAAGVLLATGQKGHRYAWPHAEISITPPTLNRVFGDTVDAQLQANQLEHLTRMYASIMSKAVGKTPKECMQQYMSRKRYFDTKAAVEEGIIDKLLPGYAISPRFRELADRMVAKKMSSKYGKASGKPQFRFKRDAQGNGA